MAGLSEAYPYPPSESTAVVSPLDQERFLEAVLPDKAPRMFRLIEELRGLNDLGPVSEVCLSVASQGGPRVIGVGFSCEAGDIFVYQVQGYQKDLRLSVGGRSPKDVTIHAWCPDGKKLNSEFTALTEWWCGQVQG